MNSQTSTLRFILFFAVLSLNPHQVQGQGFINLNFESAVPVPIAGDPGGRVQFGPAFPGWSAYYNSTPFSSTEPVTYNNPTLGDQALGLVTPAFFNGSISNVSALLQGSLSEGSPDVSLAQTALVPAGTASLRFLAYQRPTASFVVSLNGQPLSYSLVQNLGNFSEYGVNIPAFAGQIAELRFTQRSRVPFANSFLLDNISFSPVPVPEPGTWALLGLGGAAALLLRRKARRR